MDRGGWTDPRAASVTVAAWARQWLEQDATKRAKTRVVDHLTIERHIVPHIGDRSLGSVTPLEVQRLVARWVARYKPNTVRRHYAVLRTIAIAPALAKLLAQHLARRRLTAADTDAWVFSAPNGGPLRYQHFRSRVWRPARTRANLEGLGFHDLRRAAATVLVTSGVDVRTAQHRLGHSDPRLTLAVYAQVTAQADRDAAAALEDHFLAGARDERAMNGDGKVLTGAAHRPRPAQTLEPERGLEPLACSLRDQNEPDDGGQPRT